MSELICAIAQCLAAADHKVWRELTVPEQEKYAMRALMVSDVAARHFEEKFAEPIEIDVPSAAVVAKQVPTSTLSAE